jgi:uncharacterized membrane protein YheB (UPF0754 family)
MKELLGWLIPPLAGALIGYVTNAVAIRMLFRPLRAVRILGVRLPFTPGVLPRQRHKLADSIGAMVERELLTPEILRGRFRREDVRQKTGAALGAYTERLLTVPLYDQGVVRRLIPLGRRFFNSPGFASLLDELGAAEPLKKSFLGALSAAVSGFFPRGVRSFIQFLKTGEIRGELETQGRLFLNNAIFKLNVFQRFFISAGQYDRTLHERMPEIIDDLILRLEELLGQEDMRRRFLAFLNAALEDLLGKPSFSGLIQASPIGRLAGDALENFFEKNRALTLRDLFGIDASGKEKLDALLLDKLFALGDEQIPVLLGTINVRAMVSERIDALDMIDVERIVRDVMANQFRWINLFGGVLGALIGLFQALFARLI